jgi:hypothetical protein
MFVLCSRTTETKGATMLSPHEPLQCIFEVPGEPGFAIFGVAVKGHPDRIFDANVFADHASVMHHGDILVVTSRSTRHGPHANLPDAHVAAMVHKDRDGRVTLTKLLELPHDAESLRNLLAGMPAGLRQAREGASTETRPPRHPDPPAPARIADQPTDADAADGTAEGSRATRAAPRHHADGDDPAPAGAPDGADDGADDGDDTGTCGDPIPAGNVTEGPGANRRRRRGGMNLR